MKIKEYFVFLILILLLSLPQELLSQNTALKKKIYLNSSGFDLPLKIPITLSGNFAELRRNHFHSGIDLRIGGKEGESVYSPFAGEVSRIKIQAFGGGKNLYIEHTNGYTTVYMHLQNFSYKIEKYVRDYQYAKETYEFDINVPKGRLKIEKGELIAYAGNTGSSGGPHLHYEVRDTRTENIINPLHFGLEVEDTTPPYIASILIAPDGDYSRVEGMSEKQIFKNIKDNDTIRITNRVFLGIKAFDKAVGSTSRNGVYSYSLNVNDRPFWSFAIDEFSFSTTKYINACIDYEQYSKTGQTYLITKKLPNNQFPNFIVKEDNGVLVFEAGETKKIEYILKDFHSNITTLTFYLQNQPISPTNFSKRKDKPTHIFYWDRENRIIDEGIQIIMPKNALYDDCFITYWKEIDSANDNILYKINSLEAIHSNMELKIQIPQAYKNNPKLKDKLLIVEKKGRYFISKGGKQVGDWIITKVNSFGDFAISFDTISPTISSINFKNNIKLSKKQKTLRVRIKDQLSGISSYKAYLNGKWVLMEYDGKNSTLIYTIDPNELNLKANTLKIIVIDRVGNSKEEIFRVIK